MDVSPFFHPGVFRNIALHASFAAMNSDFILFYFFIAFSFSVNSTSYLPFFFRDKVSYTVNQTVADDLMTCVIYPQNQRGRWPTFPANLFLYCSVLSAGERQS